MEEITVSTGVVFRAKAVPLNAFDIVRRKYMKDKPHVPTRYIEDKGRDEPNPNDPEYLDALNEWESLYSEKVIDMVYTLGLDVVSIPDGLYGIDDKWHDKYDLLGFDIPTTGNDRYLAWIKLYAAPTMEDMLKLQNACSRMTGVPEKDVADAATTFRSKKG